MTDSTNTCTEVFIGLGANTGDPLAQLELARKRIASDIGLILQASSLYLSEPWGDPDQPWFHNQVVQVSSALDPSTIMQALLAIERDLGRVRDKPNAPRTIDLDLLFHGQKTCKSGDLVLPHPRLELRNFVLIPMMEIAAGFVHPRTGLTMEEHYIQSPDTLEVCMIEQP